MTNFEKHGKELLSFIRNHGSTPARIAGVFASCSGSSCEDCEYDSITGSCIVSFIKWLYEDDGEEHDRCDGCKYEYKREDESPCAECRNNYMSKWERRPKKKTRQDEFLEMFPSAKRCYGVVDICPKDLDKHFCCRSQEFLSGGCTTCCQDYWLQEVEE